MDFIYGDPVRRIIFTAICVLILIAYILYKWKRASRYVESRNEIYSQYRKKQKDYAERCRQDKRWAEFWQELQRRYKITLEYPLDSETYELYDLNIADVNGTTFEPNTEGSESVSFYAYLKRKEAPKYLQVEFTTDKKIIERKISSSTWYDLFERAV